MLQADEYVDERHRHRYEVNPNLVSDLESQGLRFVGKDESGQRMEIVELKGHPYFVAGQFHPEFKSRPGKPSPLFLGLILASSGKDSVESCSDASMTQRHMKSEGSLLCIGDTCRQENDVCLSIPMQVIWMVTSQDLLLKQSILRSWQMATEYDPGAASACRETKEHLLCDAPASRVSTRAVCTALAEQLAEPSRTLDVISIALCNLAYMYSSPCDKLNGHLSASRPKSTPLQATKAFL